MSLFGRTADEIIDQAMRDLQQNTPITRFTAGAKARALMRSMGRMVSNMYDTFDFNQSIGFVSGASGIYLDFIGELLNIPRLGATQARADSAEGNLMFYTLATDFGSINNGLGITVPVGTTVSSLGRAGKVVRYRTMVSTILPSAVDQFFVSIEAVQGGSVSNVGTNALVTHDFTNYTDSANETLLVTNVSPIDSGKNTESDEMYRFRIVNRAFSAENANTTAIRLAALSIATVDDVDILEYKRGIGTSNMLLKSITGFVTSEMVAAVQTVVDAVKAHGSHIIVEGPKEIGVQVSMTLRYRNGVQSDQKTGIELLVVRALRDYIMGLDIGEDLIVNEMVQRVLEVDDRILDLGSPGSPFDSIYTFHDGMDATNRVRRKLLENYPAEVDEKLILETTVATPISISRAV